MLHREWTITRKLRTTFKGTKDIAFIGAASNQGEVRLRCTFFIFSRQLAAYNETPKEMFSSLHKTQLLSRWFNTERVPLSLSGWSCSLNENQQMVHRGFSRFLSFACPIKARALFPSFVVRSWRVINCSNFPVATIWPFFLLLRIWNFLKTLPRWRIYLILFLVFYISFCCTNNSF